MGSKRGKPKEPMPEWMKAVDRDMFLYVTWERIIKQQENIILTRQLSGIRTTPVYVLREGGSGGESINQAEQIAMDIEFAKKKIAAGEKYRDDLEETIRLVAEGDPDKETFIRRYFWTGPDRRIGTRAKLVVAALPFLAHRDWGTKRPTKPNRNFYVWRDDIYMSLADYMGYGEEARRESESVGQAKG